MGVGSGRMRAATLLIALLPTVLSAAGPDDALIYYFDAVMAGDWDRAYGLVSSKDQAVRTLAEYRASQKDWQYDVVIAAS